jgi:DNA adenine methylase
MIMTKDTTVKLTSPIGWVGGKSKLAKEIVGLLPKHEKYVEVFG